MENTERKTDKFSSGMLCAGHLAVDSYGGFLTPILPFIAAKLNITIAIISLMISVAHLASSIMQPLFGYISDSLSRRFFIIWGIIIAAVFTGLSGVVSNVWILGLIIVLGNVGVAFYHPQAMALTNYFAGNKLTLVMGIFTACGTIGYAVGPVISSFLVAHFGLHSTIYAIIPGLIFVFILYKTLPKIPTEVIKKKKVSFFKVLSKIFTDKLLLILTYMAILNSMVVLSFAIWMPFVWKAQGHSVSTIGYLTALFSLCGGLGTFLGAKFANTFGRKSVYYMALFPIMPLGFLCLYFIGKIPLISFISFVLIGFFIAFAVSTNVVMAQSKLPKYRGVISGVIGGFSWGVMGVLLAPLGFIAEKVGVTNVLACISVIPLISTLLIKFIPEDLEAI